MEYNVLFFARRSGIKFYFSLLIGVLVLFCFSIDLCAQDVPVVIPNWLYDPEGDGGGTYGDEYGRAVAIDGDWLIVGARRNSISGDGYQGKVFFWHFENFSANLLL